MSLGYNQSAPNPAGNFTVLHNPKPSATPGSSADPNNQMMQYIQQLIQLLTTGGAGQIPFPGMNEIRQRIEQNQYGLQDLQSSEAFKNAQTMAPYVAAAKLGQAGSLMGQYGGQMQSEMQQSNNGSMRDFLDKQQTNMGQAGLQAQRYASQWQNPDIQREIVNRISQTGHGAGLSGTPFTGDDQPGAGFSAAQRPSPYAPAVNSAANAVFGGGQ